MLAMQNEPLNVPCGMYKVQTLRKTSKEKKEKYFTQNFVARFAPNFSPVIILWDAHQIKIVC